MSLSYSNPSLQRIRSGEAVSCVWLSLGSVALAEIAAECAPDMIVFDAQHGLWERTTLHAAVLAVRDASTPVVRVGANNSHLIGEALDSGAFGVIVPLIEDGSQAAAAVAAAHYPPRGHRSGGGVRPLANFPDYINACATDVMVSVMIETKLGLANAEEIIATPGIDLVFIGSGDLALSLGTGSADDLEGAIQQIFQLCRAKAVPCGIFTPTAEIAHARLSEGFAFVVAEDDIRLARNGMARSLSAVRKEVK